MTLNFKDKPNPMNRTRYYTDGQGMFWKFPQDGQPLCRSTGGSWIKSVFRSAAEFTRTLDGVRESTATEAGE